MSETCYWREDQFATDQTQLAISQLGQVVTGSLRQAMLTNDRPVLSAVLSDIGQSAAFRRVDIINLQGQVWASTVPTEVGRDYSLDAAGCRECHKRPAGQRPLTTLLASAPETLRVASAIVNEPACIACHPASTPHLGMLLLDVPLASLRRNLLNELQVDLIISVGISVLVTVLVFSLVHWLVVERRRGFPARRWPNSRPAISTRACRSLAPPTRSANSPRPSTAWRMTLGATPRKTSSASKAANMPSRKNAPGLRASCMTAWRRCWGTSTPKSSPSACSSAKIRCRPRRLSSSKLETASHDLFVDVRETILGLQMVGQGDIHLAEMLKEYSQRFSQLSGLQVDICIGPEAEDIELPAETELQLLRIVQEALTNIRKHAAAAGAQVSFQVLDGRLELRVSDDGQGFDPAQARRDLPRTHFGLDIMRERAEAIGATFHLESRPEAGAVVTLQLPLAQGGLACAFS